MTPRAWWLLTLLLHIPSCAFAYPRPLPGTENIPALIAQSTLACKGEVVEAPTPLVVRSPTPPRMTATAEVHLDRCFKGVPPGSSISVLFDGLLPAVGGPVFVLRKSDYRLFFLRPQKGQYEVVDQWFGALSASRELGPVPESADSMFLLELDLKAGLRDSDPDRVLDSVRMLGNMNQLRSTAELRNLLASPDLLVRTYVWQALLRLKDYSALPAIAEFFDSQPVPPSELFLPRDRLLEMQVRLQREIGVIRDPSTLPDLERFAVSRSDRLRASALDALRAIGSAHSAATFLKALDDPSPDNGFSAMQGLLSLAGGGPIGWVPTWKRFDEAPQFYAAKCREWWNAEGKQKVAAAVTNAMK